MPIVMKWIKLYLKKSEPLDLTIESLLMVLEMMRTLLKLGGLWSPSQTLTD